MTIKKLDEFHYHELIDRCSIINDNIESNLISHPASDNGTIMLLRKAQRYIYRASIRNINNAEKKFKGKIR